MTISFGCDHGGFPYKEAVLKHLKEKGYEVLDFGTFSTESCHYPEFAFPAAEAIRDHKAEKGILICSSGEGVSMCANKVKGIRAAAVSEPVSARLSKEHNNANILCFGARIVGVEMAKAIVDAWLNAHFLGGRHQMRIDQITALEEKGSI